MRPRVLVRGAGEHATGTAHRLFRCGIPVVMTEMPEPAAVRRLVAFSTAVHDRHTEVEGVVARRWAMSDAWRLGEGPWDHVPVFVDPEGDLIERWRPEVLVDARLLKRPSDTSRHQAPLVIGLGPGLRAGRDVHVVVETHRGHDLGRLWTEGEALADTGIPGPIGGFTVERVLRAPADGVLEAARDIGERVDAGGIVARVSGREVRAVIDGVVRGLIRPGSSVTEGQKIGDIDPRGDLAACFTLSEKTRTLSGAVLEAILGQFPIAHEARPGPWPAPDHALLDPTGRARYIHLVGGGGKTTLLFGWSRELARRGERVLCATTTRIRFPTPEASPAVIVEPDPARLVPRIADAVAAWGRVTAVRQHLPGSAKTLGHPPEVLDAVLDAGVVDRVLVEADGSAGRPVKAHAHYEPVISRRADLVVLVVGASAFGEPADDRTVHRADLYRERLGRLPEDLVHPGDVAATLLHPDGWIRTLPPGVPVSVLVTQVRSPERWQATHALARALLSRDQGRHIRCVVAGDLIGIDPRITLVGTA